MRAFRWAQLMRDARYYGAVVVEEEGSMCAVVLATKLAEVRPTPPVLSEPLPALLPPLTCGTAASDHAPRRGVRAVSSSCCGRRMPSSLKEADVPEASVLMPLVSRQWGVRQG